MGNYLNFDSGNTRQEVGEEFTGYECSSVGSHGF